MKERPPQCYACWYRLNGAERFLPWFEGEGADDFVATDGLGRVPTFGSTDELKAFVEALGGTLAQEAPVLHDLDSVAIWLTHPSTAGVESDVLLSAWNLFGDVARSVGEPFDADPDARIDVYQKLFWANNLPAMTPPGERYEPGWTEDEVKRIAEVLARGLEVFRRVVAAPDQVRRS